MRVLNWEMVKHPMNWITVVLMVLIAGVAFHFFMSYQTGKNPFENFTSS